MKKLTFATRSILNEHQQMGKDISDYIPFDEQTPEICLVAVGQDGRALRYVKEQTPEICLAAVKRCPVAAKYIRI